MALVSCKNVAVSYDSDVILHDISFDVDSADYICIVGENGAGKTTLVKAILGLVPLRAGKIEFGDGLKRNEIGYLPQQNGAQVDFPASVWEVVLSGCLNERAHKPFYSKAQKDRALEKLRLLDIERIKDSSFRSLSGGQRQRVLMARALCATNKLIVLDEPITGLDPVMTQELYHLLHRLNQETGVTILMVSHDVKSAIGCCSKVLHIRNTIAFYGDKHAYLESETGKHFLEDIHDRHS